MRELTNRLFVLPPESPTWDVIREQEERAETRQQAARRVDEIDEALAPFSRST